MRRALVVSFLALLTAGPAAAKGPKPKDPCKDTFKTVDTGFGVRERAGFEWFGKPVFMFEKRDGGWRVLASFHKTGAVDETLPRGAQVQAMLATGEVLAIPLDADVRGVLVAGYGSVGTQFDLDLPVPVDLVRRFTVAPVKGLRVVVGDKELVTSKVEDDYGVRIQDGATCILAR